MSDKLRALYQHARGEMIDAEIPPSTRQRIEDYIEALEAQIERLRKLNPANITIQTAYDNGREDGAREMAESILVAENLNDLQMRVKVAMTHWRARQKEGE